MEALAKRASEAIQTKDVAKMAEVYDEVSMLAAGFERMHDLIKDTMKRHVETHGEVYTEAGSKRITAGGWTVPVVPGGGGIDDRKLEAKLRAKAQAAGVLVGELLAKYMDADAVYRHNATKFERAKADGLLTAQDEKDVMAPRTFSLRKPTKAPADG